MSATTEPAIAELAQLSRLALSEQELAMAALGIGRLRAYIVRIQAIDPSTAGAAMDPDGALAPLQPDQARAGLSDGQALASTPGRRSDYFAVPKVLEGTEP